MFNIKEKSFAYGKHQVTLSTGKIARQATGSVEVTIGNTVVLVTAVVAKEAKPDQSFFPLTVHYQEKTYAAGKIPGSFFRREARPSEKETLLSRLVDRPIRPLFPKGFLNEVLVMAQVISLDENVQTEVPAMIGASAALALTGAPFQGPIGAAKVGYINGEFILNPSTEEFKNSDLELSVAGTKDAVLMVESEANQLPEDTMLDAVMFGHKQMQVVIDNINELVAEAGKPQWDWTPASTNENLKQLVSDKALQGISEAYQITNKQERQQALRSLRHKIFDKIQAEATEEIKSSDIESEFGALEKSVVRDKIIAGEARIDGRDTTTVRPIECEVGLYPKIHGSALFTRGETQAFVAVTLGTDRDAQLMDDLEGKFDEKFLFHYNFPPYSVGECGRVMGPGRREIGHGKLAKRGIQAVTPSAEEFPYVIRVVSEITESNGSSSMASVCGSSLAMMDAGIPLSNPVSGIAMGLIKEGDKYVVLSDILGDEDHLGDMDFKVAGTEQGITALQMDIKIQGITEEIMQQALKQASDGRKHILGEMAKALSAPKSDLSPYAPRMTSITVATDKIGDVIGKGGSTIRSIQEETGAVVDINDDGVITVSTNNQEAADKAIAIIESLTKDIEADEIYEGKVIKIVDFGAFVSLTPGKDGLLHISEIDNSRVQNVEDFIKEGDTIKVKVISIDRQGKIRLSRKALL
jgi:polyribonucleotide nucleotidyltransferase